MAMRRGRERYVGSRTRWWSRAGLGALAAAIIAIVPASVAFATTSGSTSTSTSTSAPTTTTTYGGAPTTMTFTGALHGTLHIVPMDDCSAAGSGGATLEDIAGSLGGSSAKQWTIIIYAPHNGKYTFVKHPKSGLESFSFVIETPGKSTVVSWADTGGSMTSSNGKGSANLVLSGRTGGAHGTVHVKGSWDCPVET